MTTLRDLANGHYILAPLPGWVLAAVPHDDPLAPVARRLKDGTPKRGDQAALGEWLASHPQFAVPLPGAPEAPPLPAEYHEQLALWDAA